MVMLSHVFRSLLFFCTDPQLEFYNSIHVDNNMLQTLMSNTGMAYFLTKSKVICACVGSELFSIAISTQ